ncbi:perlucin-like protein [Procambarus clarkii]|uniref:Lectin n=1 Tax=Procambarus clarkii TaxID=6728 RepID=I1Z0D0_PROCL|nr:lectin [Procambarus clarkii]
MNVEAFLLLLGSVLVYGDSPINKARYPAADITCPLPYKAVGGRCILFAVAEAGAWHDMGYFCETLGGKLVVIDDSTFMEALTDYILDGEFSTTEFWIGATDEVTEGVWKWVNGKTVRMRMPLWLTCSDDQEPNGGSAENCLAITSDHNYYFVDADCALAMNPICEYTVL